MRRIHVSKLTVILPLVVVLAALAGCPPAPQSPTSKPDESGGGDTSTVKKAENIVVKDKPTGTLKGRVTVAGDPTGKLKNLKDENDKLLKESGQDAPVCLAGDTEVQKLVLGKDNGVANAVVWVRPAGGARFLFDKPEVDELRKKRTPPVIDQPHCAFKPRVTAMWPAYYDLKAKKQETGEKLVVKNSATINHNTKPSYDASLGRLLNKKSGDTVDQVTLDIPLTPKEPVSLSCDVHKFMVAYVWGFDHPFAAVTDKDGNFEIKNVPADVELNVYAWHELGQDGQAPGLINPGKDKGKKLTLDKDKDATENFELKLQ
jgi:hypothetical protein